MTRLILAALAAAIAITVGAAISASNAKAGPTGYANTGWGCHTCWLKNGTQLAGIVLPELAGSDSMLVGNVILPTGETVDPR